MQNEFQNSNLKHFKDLWDILPPECPLRLLGFEPLESLLLPIDRHALVKIDPTRRYPYSLLLTEYFSETPDASLVKAIHDHQEWLAKHDVSGLEQFLKQLAKCSAGFTSQDKLMVRAADAVEYINNSRKRDGYPITREEIRELTRQNDPDLFADDAGANRDLHKRIERVYGEIKRDRVGRPSETGK